MRVGIDRDLCIGAGCCVAEAPRVFLMDEERKAFVRKQPAAGDAGPDGRPSEDAVRRAAAACPTGAVRIEPETGSQPAT